MANIKTADCKQAIVQFVLNNPGYIGAQFCDQHGKSGTPFKATSCGVPVGTTVRMFECSSGEEAQNTYEDQLRAYTYDDGQKIIKVEIAGE